VGCRKAGGNAWLTAAAWHFLFWGFDMFWTFYGAHEDRLVGRPGKTGSQCDPSHAGTHSARKTAEQLFFIIEDLTDTGADKPIPATR
jgi:hypothetical protein